MKILLFGKNGQVGWELQRALAPLGEVVALDARGSADLRGDFTLPQQLAVTVRKVAPDVIVNAAAYTAVDKAESEPELALVINATAPSVLAREAAACGAWLVHYSTDYVFDGSGTRPWREDDATGPLNAYGRTKLEGENAIRASGCRHLILRTSWVYAARGNNFAKTILRLAKERDHLKVIDDQFGAPTGADLLADVTTHAVRAAVGNPSLGGAYHVTASGETSWHGYACRIIEFARGMASGIRVASDAIEAVPSSAFATAAKRPHNSRMDSNKLSAAFDLAMPRWELGVERMLAELSESY